jgi:hypothetical protein
MAGDANNARWVAVDCNVKLEAVCKRVGGAKWTPPGDEDASALFRSSTPSPVASPTLAPTKWTDIRWHAKGLVCDAGWTLFQKTRSCYRALLNAATSTEQETRCLAYGAHAVSIRTAQENAFVYTLAQSQTTWIGLRSVVANPRVLGARGGEGARALDPEFGWVWYDYAAEQFRAWAADEPLNPNFDAAPQDARAVCVAMRRSAPGAAAAAGIGADAVATGWIAAQCDEKMPVICKKTATRDALDPSFGQHFLEDQYHRRLGAHEEQRAAHAAAAGKEPCPPGWSWHRTSAPGAPCAGRCYYYERDVGSSSAQETACIARGGHLATARSDAEHAAVVALATARRDSARERVGEESPLSLSWLGMLYAFPTAEETSAELMRDFGWIHYDASAEGGGSIDGADSPKFARWGAEQPAAPAGLPAGSFLCVALDASDAAKAHWAVRRCDEELNGVCEQPARPRSGLTACEEPPRRAASGSGPGGAPGGARMRGGKARGATARESPAKEGRAVGEEGRAATTTRERPPVVARAGCAPGWHLFNGTKTAGAVPGRPGSQERDVCFKVLHAPMTHREASAECRNVGTHLDNDERIAHLAAVTSAAESAFARTLLTPARDTWIGIFYAFEVDPDPRISLDPEFGWLWRDRRLRSPYTNWANDVRRADLCCFVFDAPTDPSTLHRPTSPPLDAGAQEPVADRGHRRARDAAQREFEPSNLRRDSREHRRALARA